ncbi:hypothetical protein QUC31_005904 [Theobroma cacao]|uniref:Ribonuclease 2, putative n=1 Tax=Theobroma cacao TaxID=3641 RepID=A0A061G8H3_THECC|nr:Ribonuclease 2, putative [Theobroma cacao]
MQRHLLVAAVLATFSLLVSGQNNYPDFFYKLSLQWPPAVCATSQCRTPIPGTFTIHGLWPQFVKDDRPVPPYNPTTNKCNDVKPTAPDQILVSLQPIRDKLNKLWPSLLMKNTNEDFWRLEWERHGMCSDYLDDPGSYFTTALNLATTNNPLKGLVPRQDLYKASEISEAINTKLGKYPEISCGKVSNTLQLNEIRLCFERAKPPSVLRDCPKRYSNGCSNGNDQVKFPPLTSRV